VGKRKADVARSAGFDIRAPSLSSLRVTRVIIKIPPVLELVGF
jgi:hypothetical protein